MTIRVNDPAFPSLLASATGPADLIAADGRVLGTFLPRPPIDLKTVKPAISEEELRRREQDTTSKGYTTAEVLAYLRSLPCSD